MCINYKTDLPTSCVPCVCVPHWYIIYHGYECEHFHMLKPTDTMTAVFALATYAKPRKIDKIKSRSDQITINV